MADKIFLYWASGSPPCWRVMLALEEKGLSGYGNKFLKFDKNEHKSEEVLKWNPRGQLPTCVFNNSFAINESHAVVEYLERMYPKQGTSLTPEDPQELAKMLQRKAEISNLDGRGHAFIYYKMFNKGEKDPEHVKKLMNDVYEELKNWNKYAGETEFIGGNKMTMADVIFFPYLALLKRFGLNLEEKAPNLAKYYEKMAKRPTVEKTWPPHWKENAPPASIFV